MPAEAMPAKAADATVLPPHGDVPRLKGVLASSRPDGVTGRASGLRRREDPKRGESEASGSGASPGVLLGMGTRSVFPKATMVL